MNVKYLYVILDVIDIAQDLWELFKHITRIGLKNSAVAQ